MLSSPSSKSDTAKRNKWIVVHSLTWMSRILVGALFIFSGFVKAVDPWGSIYKFEEYFRALGLPVIHSLLLISVFLLCAFEFIVGVCVLTGSYRRLSPIAALLFMVVMLPLTLWVAVSDPVKDCGCFGDFLVISNWATFWKNVALTLLVVWLLKFNSRQPTVITPALQWIEIVFTLIFISAVIFYGYFIQPALDFRPYAVGTPIAVEQESLTGDQSLKFVYEKNGVQKEFSVYDELPSEDDGWVFVERKGDDKNAPETEDEKTFRIWDREGNLDETDQVLSADSIILLLIPDLARVSPAKTWEINTLNEAAAANGIEMIAVVSGSTEQIDDWEDLSMPQYEIYTSDDTAIKELARGNPAVVFIKDGIIEWKSTLGALNVAETIKDGKFDAEAYKIDSKTMLRNWTLVYLAAMLVLVAFSLLPRLRKVYVRRDDKARPEE